MFLAENRYFSGGAVVEGIEKPRQGLHDFFLGMVVLVAVQQVAGQFPVRFSLYLFSHAVLKDAHHGVHCMVFQVDKLVGFVFGFP